MMLIRVFSLLLLLVFQGTVLPVTDPASVLAEASAAYANGDYATAAHLYESLIESGVRNPGLYVNLGNAYYQSGLLGQALLNYRRAQLYWPRDMELNSYVSRVTVERVDLLGDETGWVESLSSATTTVFTLTELAVVVGLIWLLWVGVLITLVMRPAWRDRARLPLVTLTIILVITMVLVGGRLWLTSNRPAAVVLQTNAQVMSGPGENYLGLFELHEAAELHIWEQRDGWVKFALPDGRLGWLPSDAVAWVIDR